MSVQELEAAARGWYEAVAKVDIDAVVDAYAADGNFFDSVPYRFDSGESYEVFTRWAMETMVSASSNLYQLECRMLGDNVGVVTAHDFFAASRSEGPGVRITGRATMIFSKESGEWKMIHGHFSQTPVPPAG